MKRTPLPEGCEATIKFYLSSQKADAKIVIGLGELADFPDLADHAAGPLKLVQSLAASVGADLLTVADDWRFMSRAEIADYKARQRAEASSCPDDEEGF